ncbi:hypothetical protein TIFTF001_026379 [Ficus carica]|uniref:C2H2-type domain-containing protein n=1 Tax=Ficus carica TaxID=3494 RepID=A0AA88IYL5_FICCA|nr:hypothetical protein TIFTF001_026379 [Ficus carica]
MKRSIAERDQMENVTMANCLMFLSRGASGATFNTTTDHHHHHQFQYSTSTSPSRVFECKTCNRQFPSFQALGGHRASHKKPRVLTGSDGSGGSSSDSQGSPAKPKTHECTVCGLEFAIGQALGGHMRRHRAAMADNHHVQAPHPLLMSSSSSSSTPTSFQVPVLKKTTSSRRVLCLDLNLTPLENDIKILQLGKTVQLVDCFF